MGQTPADDGHAVLTFLAGDAVQLSRKVRQQLMGKSTVVDSRRGRRGPLRTVRSNAADNEGGFPPGRSRRSPLPEGHLWIGHPDLGVSGSQLREGCLRFGEEVRATLRARELQGFRCQNERLLAIALSRVEPG